VPASERASVTRASLRGVELGYERVGRGVPILLMHGWLGLDHTYLRPYLDPLGEVAELVFYDHRGHGRSSAVDDWSGIDHATFADDADALREHLGHERIVVLGHSYGGFLAQEYALRYPERLAGLVLCATAPALDYARDPRRLVAASGVAATDDQLEQAERIFETLPESDEEYRRERRAVMPLYFADPSPRRLARFEAATYRAAPWRHAVSHLLPGFNVADRLGAVTAPALVLGGRHDWVCPPTQAARLTGLLPRSELVFFEQSGHYPFVEETDEFVRVVREWLDRLPGA
jgi:proline iminopeptidase